MALLVRLQTLKKLEGELFLHNFIMLQRTSKQSQVMPGSKWFRKNARIVRQLPISSCGFLMWHKLVKLFYVLYRV